MSSQLEKTRSALARGRSSSVASPARNSTLHLREALSRWRALTACGRQPHASPYQGLQVRRQGELPASQFVQW